jgi:hypothetical protein
MRVIRLDVPAEELADLRLAMVNGDPEVRVAQFADLRDPDRPPTAAASAGASGAVRCRARCRRPAGTAAVLACRPAREPSVVNGMPTA